MVFGTFVVVVIICVVVFYKYWILLSLPPGSLDGMSI